MTPTAAAASDLDSSGAIAVLVAAEPEIVLDESDADQLLAAMAGGGSDDDDEEVHDIIDFV